MPFFTHVRGVDGTVLEHSWEYASAPAFRLLLGLAARRSALQAQDDGEEEIRQTQSIRALLVGGALALAGVMAVQLGMLAP